MAGLTSTGFEIKDLDTILTEIETEEKNLLGQSLNVRPTSVPGVFNGVFSAKLSELWEVTEEVYAAWNPDTATGVSLDLLCQLTGTIRLAATNSDVSLSLVGTPGTPIPALRRVKNASTNTYWTNPLSGVIGAGSSVAIDFEAEETGPLVGIAGTLTVIDTPVSGWSSVTNALDAVVGTDEETDADLRVRRAELLTSAGKGTVDSIRADVRDVDDVDDVAVYENTTLVTDADGLPGKAFEVLVSGGDVDDIAQAIWDSKPAGISAHGSASGTAYDALTAARVMFFSRPTDKNVYASITAITGAGWGGATSALASALVEYGNEEFGIGDTVYGKMLYTSLFEVSGVVDVPGLNRDFFASPTAAGNLAIGTRERASFDTSRVDVTLL